MEISSVNCGKVVGKVEGNLQNGDEIPTNGFELQTLNLGKHGGSTKQ